MSRRSFARGTLFLVALWPVAPAAARPVSYSLSDANAPGQITFESKAPAEYIEGTAEGVSGSMRFDEASADLGLKASVFVPVEKMRTGNTTRDGHLRSAEWLNAERYPTIRFELAATPKKNVVKKGPDVWFVNATGVFSLKGVDKKISVPVTIRREKKDGESMLHVEGRFTVLLDDYNIRGPMGIRMIGVKVSPDVRVGFHLVAAADKGWEKLPAKK